jgi:hypothetical protein
MLRLTASVPARARGRNSPAIAGNASNALNVSAAGELYRLLHAGAAAFTNAAIDQANRAVQDCLSSRGMI